MAVDHESLLGSDTSAGKMPHHRYYVMGGFATSLTAVAIAGFLAGRLTASPQLEGVITTIGCSTAANISNQLYSPRLNPTYDAEMAAKHAVRKFDEYLMFQAAFDTPEQKLRNVRQWLADDFEYQTIGFPGAKSVADWCLSGEEQHFRTTFNESEFTQMLFFGTDTMASTTSYGTVFWAEPLLGIPAPKKWTRFRVTDFYKARITGPNEAHLYWNFMMIDYVDLLRRNGIEMVPPAPLPDGFVAPPYNEDGVPAPLSVLTNPQQAVQARKVCWQVLQRDWAGDAASGLWDKEIAFYGPGGIGRATSSSQLEKHILKPFRSAFADRSLDVQVFDCEGYYCGATGFIKGRLVKTWLGLRASGQNVALRFAFHWRIKNGKAVGGWAMFDIPDLFTQVGLDFFGKARELAKFL